MKIKTIVAGYVKVDGGAFFGVVPKVLWQKLLPADENNLIANSLRLLLIDDGEHKILVDTGLGNKQDEKFFKNYHRYGNHNLVQVVEENGYLAEEITDVILTHLHADHSGGAVTTDVNGNYIPTFPNAKYWVSHRQWEHALTPNQREKAAFLPENYMPLYEQDRLHFVEQDTELYPNIFLKHHFGHTPGLLSVHIELANSWLIYTSDFIPTAYHVYEPYIMSYDICAEKTLQEKAEFFDWVVGVKHCIIFNHDPVNECGIIYRDKKGHRVKETFTLEHYLRKL